ncbi:type I-C CRISPR-associated protein Cas8c/Csd1 [Desulfonema magnum]|uniref:CRISPR-associated protein Cas8c/Csd1, subtype I-C/DVULG n=1 Tax=Desulfonema magnum TaxID=45655 RepID=A0A975BXS2_9BACT|nr:type I-C CRISPR-associated protein Cas8c/Csd1 [Desulfonema magnum]QTA93786.1 CRISPR-associated protein Cas8c/Csd1, subtype I-C/DVULG [Desulfonema magnum]
MILHSLNNYYNRLKDDSETDIPLFGFGSQKFYFALLLNRKGELLQPLDLRDESKKKPIPRTLIVPQEMEERSGSKIAPHFMWDNTMYVLGNDNKGKPKRSSEAFEAFKKFHHDLCDGMDDQGMKAVLNFLDSWDPEHAPNLKHWDEMSGMNIVFQLDGDLQYVHERPEVRETWLRCLEEKGSGVIANCLVNGKKTSVARLHPAIKGVRGAQQKGAAIVSFNLDAFLSYGKTQSFNAPVSEEAVFAYTAALNYLLRPESRQKVQIGDASTIFWTERASPVEGFMGVILEPKDDSGDMKDVREFLEAARDGKKPHGIDPDIEFYILGLSPNASRLSVRFWHVSTVGDIRSKIGQHFRDLSIIKNYDNDPDYPGMWQLLRETATLRKSENISPLLAGAMMRSILTGEAYPRGLLTAIITRIRADQTVSYLRAAMIKAFLVRKFRINKPSDMEVDMSLNEETTNVAYRLGRLFAVLEKAQVDAHKPAKINATIKDRYYGSASATPRSVFPQLLRLTQNHLKKIKSNNKGRDWGTDKKIENIMQGIKEFPPHLNLDEQGFFALGYYHQKPVLYLKSEKNKED